MGVRKKYKRKIIVLVDCCICTWNRILMMKGSLNMNCHTRLDWGDY